MRLLLHICCGPCAVYPVKELRSGGVEVTGFFYNHNIQLATPAGPVVPADFAGLSFERGALNAGSGLS